MAKYRRDMSASERIAYRRRKRLIRKIQVYSEIGAIVLSVVIVSALIISHLNGDKDKKVDAAGKDNQQVKTEGLKVSSGKQPEEETIAEEEIVATAAPSSEYSAKETANTASISGDVVSEYGILINNKSKTIVAGRNATERIVPASMTKVLTVLVAANNITEEQLNEKVVMSHEAVDYSYGGGGSTSGFIEGETVSVKDLFYGTILPSGGDAATQLAMYVAGDVDSFVKMMNEEAEALGLTGSHFTNPVGFHSDDHYSTPYDISIIMMAALDNPICREVLSSRIYTIPQDEFRDEDLIISNWFIRRIEDKDFGGTILGAKTGFVDESGSCAVSAMTSSAGTEYICCTAKSSSSWRCINDHVDIYKTYATQ